MIVTESELLEGVVCAIVNAVHPEQVVLFGSVARGDASSDSDIDLLIVESEPFGKDRPRAAETGQIERALMDFDVPIDVLVYSRDEVAAAANGHHLVSEAYRTGKVLYDRRV